MTDQLELEIEKFPEITFQGRPVVWDSRQSLTPTGEWVLILDDEYSVRDHQTELRKRPNAKSLGALGSGCDFEVSNPRKFLGEIASAQFGHPSQKLVIVGVTGTNGKTTTALLMGHLAQSLGKTVAVLGTLGVQIWRDGKIVLSLETGFTTPEAPTVHSLFAQFLKLGVSHVFMEVSSHALTLDRVGGVDFDGGIFTNLTQDHLDFHKTMERYEEAKGKLFREYLARTCFSPESGISASSKHKFSVINGNDSAGFRLLLNLPVGSNVLSFVENKNYHLKNHSLSGIEIAFDDLILKSAMVGKFNVENIMGAFLALSKLCPDQVSDLVFALKSFRGARGRLERAGMGGDFDSTKHVFVDYAHTPDALEKVLSTVKALKAPTQNLWVVFGCGGDRDRGKRPLMGKIAQTLADFVVVTSDNPRTEKAEDILSDIQKGMDALKTGTYQEIDRERAIAFAIGKMNPDDLLVIAGKGHEDYQIVGTEKKHFSDFEVAEKCLRK